MTCNGLPIQFVATLALFVAAGVNAWASWAAWRRMQRADKRARDFVEAIDRLKL